MIPKALKKAIKREETSAEWGVQRWPYEKSFVGGVRFF